MKKMILAGAVVISILMGAGMRHGALAQTGRALPAFERDPTWPPKLPNNWVMGQMSGVAIDRRDAIQPAFDAVLGIVDEVFTVTLVANPVVKPARVTA